MINSCFEHAYRLDDEIAALLARPGIFVTPTLWVTRSEAWMRTVASRSTRSATPAALIGDGFLVEIEAQAVVLA